MIKDISALLSYKKYGQLEAKNITCAVYCAWSCRRSKQKKLFCVLHDYTVWRVTEQYANLLCVSPF